MSSRHNRHKMAQNFWAVCKTFTAVHHSWASMQQRCGGKIHLAANRRVIQRLTARYSHDPVVNLNKHQLINICWSLSSPSILQKCRENRIAPSHGGRSIADRIGFNMLYVDVFCKYSEEASVQVLTSSEGIQRGTKAPSSVPAVCLSHDFQTSCVEGPKGF